MYHGTKTTLCTFSENAPYVQEVYNHMPAAKRFRHKNARTEKTKESRTRAGDAALLWMIWLSYKEIPISITCSPGT